MPKPRPKLDFEALKQARKSEGAGKYKIQMSSRINTLLKAVERGHLPDQIVSFEVLTSVFDARCHGFDHPDLQDVYPRVDWQEQTITVPLELLRPLVVAWQKYRNSPPQTTIGECLNLEGRGQGSHRRKSRLETLNRHIDYANQVVIEYLAPRQGKEVSIAAAVNTVAARESVSPKTVDNAYKSHGMVIIEALDRLGLLLK